MQIHLHQLMAKQDSWMISSFRRVLNEISVTWAIMRRGIVVRYRSLGTCFWFLLHKSNNRRRAPDVRWAKGYVQGIALILLGSRQKRAWDSSKAAPIGGSWGSYKYGKSRKQKFRKKEVSWRKERGLSRPKWKWRRRVGFGE
jgi:hypothetical protein